MTGLGQDIRLFLRQSRRRPIWTASVVAVLALGIGANTGMYAAFDAWVSRPLPFEDPTRLVLVNESQPQRDQFDQSVAPLTYEDVRRQQRSFEAIAAFEEAFFNIADSAEPVRLRGCRVSYEMFPMLGIDPIVGRHFRAEDDLPGQPVGVAILSERIWRERYESNPDVIGTEIRVDGRVHEIIGVFPTGFRFPNWAEIRLPLGLAPDNFRRDHRWLDVIARLKPGVNLDEASADLDGIGSRIATEAPETNEGFSLTANPLRELWVPPVIDIAMGSSMGAALFLLLIVCANVASLMLARAWSRSREHALRRALGATRWRHLQQTLVETTGIALAAAAVGLLMAAWWIDWMYELAPIDPPYLFSMEIDGGIVAYTLSISLAAGVICALAPALRATGVRVHEELRSGGRSVSAGIRTTRMRSTLVIAELALSTALAMGALLMTKSFIEQQSLDLGYRTEAVAVTRLTLSGNDFEERNERSRFIERVQQEIAADPRVLSVGSTTRLPSSQGFVLRQLEAEGRQAERGELVRAALHGITGRYLETLQIDLVAGRYFTDAELREGGDVVIISESLARQLWDEAQVVGRRLRNRQTESGPWLRVVGVVREVAGSRDMVPQQGMPSHQIYQPYPDILSPGLTLAVASAAPPADVAELTRRAIRRAGISVPISEVLSMQDAIFQVQWVTRCFSQMLGAYGLMALVIAAIGLYGLVVDSVSQRGKEFAVRMAIGARREDIIGTVVRGSVVLGALGIALGIGVGLVGSRLAASMLIGVSPTDPLVLATVVLTLTGAILLASYLPARGAAAVDTARMLKAD